MAELDSRVFRDLSYGLYIVTSKDIDKINGQIVNTVIQVTSVPPRVAVIINNITGKITAIDRAGAIVYYPFIQDVYILDKSEQSTSMTSANISAEYPEGNPVILKTRDGGDVSLDLIIQYRLISEIADKVVQNTGKGDVFKEKWIRDYAKTICRYEFGELEIGEFPDAEKRRLKTQEASKELDRLLNQHGILMTSLNFIDYRYYREYFN